MAPKRRGVPAAGAGEPAAKRARGEEEEGEFTGVRFKALLRDPSTAGKGEGLAVGTPLWGRGGGGRREGQVMEPPSPAVGWLQAAGGAPHVEVAAVLQGWKPSCPWRRSCRLHSSTTWWRAMSRFPWSAPKFSSCWMGRGSRKAR